MGVTQKDIARDLGISLITVQRALNNSGYVSKELKQRILDWTKKVNYVPHKASQVLVRNKVRRIALFSSSLPEYFWNDIRTGINIASEQIKAFNYEVRYHNVPEENSRSYLRTLKKEISDGLDGVGFVNQWIYDMGKVIATVERAGIPYITFNVDAPSSNRSCYIGPEYESGGRLAGEFIGKTLQSCRRANVLVITSHAGPAPGSDAPDLNRERLNGFISVMEAQFSNVKCIVESITTQLTASAVDHQIEDILRKRKGTVRAVYLIAAFNSPFLRALEDLDYRGTITVLHDLDTSANHHLETHLLSAVVYQNPILQGYYAVKTLEQILESGTSPKAERNEIFHNLLLAENRSLYRNHYLMTNTSDL